MTSALASFPDFNFSILRRNVSTPSRVPSRPWSRPCWTLEGPTRTAGGRAVGSPPRGSWLGQLAALLACMPLKTRVSVIDGLETGQAFELLPTAMQRETMRELLKEEM